MPKTSFIFIEILFLFLILIVFPSLLITKTPFYFQENDKLQISLDSGKKYVYKFNHPANLNTLSLQLKNPLIQNNSRIVIELENSLGNSLAQFVFFGSNVGDPGWLDLNFPPVSDTSFAINLTTDNTIPESLFLLSDPGGNWDLKTTYQTPELSNRLQNTINSLFDRFQKMDPFYLSFYLLVLIILNWVFLKK